MMPEEVPKGAGDEEEVLEVDRDVEKGEDIRIMHHSIQLKIFILIKLYNVNYYVASA